jgi:hypothetical protein
VPPGIAEWSPTRYGRFSSRHCGAVSDARALGALRPLRTNLDAVSFAGSSPVAPAKSDTSAALRHARASGRRRALQRILRPRPPCRRMRELRRASATRGEIRDATVAASVALGEAAIPQLVRARALRLSLSRSVATVRAGRHQSSWRLEPGASIDAGLSLLGGKATCLMAMGLSGRGESSLGD